MVLASLVVEPAGLGCRFVALPDGLRVNEGIEGNGLLNSIGVAYFLKIASNSAFERFS